ncbi:MAG TPA: exo-alpha-sialidase [Clostridiales bacterium]|nr:exo-alpha-sialidase [Clostridiales bacterium]
MECKVIKKEFIFEDDRPYKSCHASTILYLPGGEMISAWFGGTHEGADDVAIWFSRRTQTSWTYPVKAADIEGIPHWNPVLFKRNDGTILLFYQDGHKIRDWKSKLTMSKDCGKKWSEPKEIVEGARGGRGPIKNKPIILADGTWLAPCSCEIGPWNAFVDISTDEGISWTKSKVIPLVRDPSDNSPYFDNNESTINLKNMPELPGQYFVVKGRGVIQPTLWESDPGNVHMLLRSCEGLILRSDSRDSGKTWSPVYSAGLPNNNSGIDIVKLDNGTLVLVCNPVGKDWGPRTPLVIYVSCDNGQIWENIFTLENEPGEFSYPAIIAKGNEVFITYTWRRERISFWHMVIE